MARPYKYNADSLQFVFDEYKEHIKAQGFIKPVYNQQLDKVVQMLIPRQMSVESFCLFADIDNSTFANYIDLNLLSDKEKEDVKMLKGNVSNEVIEVSERTKLFLKASRICDEIRDKRIAAAESGVTNAGLIARIYSITDNVNVNNTGTKETININIDGKKVDLS